MAEIFSQMTAMADQCLNQWNEIYEFLRTAEGSDKNKFDLGGNIASTGMNLEHLNARASTVFGRISSFESLHVNEQVLISGRHITELLKLLSNANSIHNTGIKFVENAKLNGLKILDVKAWNAIENVNNQQLNFSSLLATIVPALDDISIKCSEFIPMIHASILRVLDPSLIEHVSKLAAQAETDSKETSDSRKQMEKEVKVALATSSSIKDIETRIASTLDKADSSLEASRTVSTQINTNVAEARRAIQISRTLEGDIATSRVKLGELTDFMDKNSKDIYAKFAKQREKIEANIDQSTAMLKGATNAGLSVVFDNAGKKLDEELVSARDSFNGALWMLSGSGLAFILYILFRAWLIHSTAISEIGVSSSGSLSNFITSFFSSDSNIGITITLFLITMPFVWRVKFAASRHNQLFRLREHYMYKYSLAMSVEGFREQSTGYENEIAMATFESLRFNPADRMEGGKKSDESPNPIVDAVMEKLGLNSKGKNVDSAPSDLG